MLDILKDYGKPNVNAKQVAKVLGKAIDAVCRTVTVL